MDCLYYNLGCNNNRNIYRNESLNMKHLFVQYGLAIQLKEKHFNEPCFGFYNHDNDLEFFDSNLFDEQKTNSTLPDIIDYLVEGDDNPKYNFCTAPTHQQVVDWFREKHIRIVESPTIFDDETWLVTLDVNAPKDLLEKIEFKGFLTLNNAIQEGLNLI